MKKKNACLQEVKYRGLKKERASTRKGKANLGIESKKKYEGRKHK
jgi:hypothetical protein